AAALANNKIYFYGGVSESFILSDFFTSMFQNRSQKTTYRQCRGYIIYNWTKLYPGPIPIEEIQGYSVILLNNLSILYIGGQPGGNVRTLPYSLFDQ
ncbi:22899_t:CDS:2, partial [Gigaspora rosea]